MAHRNAHHSRPVFPARLQQAADREAVAGHAWHDDVVARAGQRLCGGEHRIGRVGQPVQQHCRAASLGHRNLERAVPVRRETRRVTQAAARITIDEAVRPVFVDYFICDLGGEAFLDLEVVGPVGLIFLSCAKFVL